MPWLLVAVVAAIALAVWSPHLLVVTLALLVGIRADSQLEALTAAAASPVDGQEVTVVTDPREGSFGRWAIVALGDERLIASTADFDPSLSFAEAGDRLVVSGSVIGERPESNWEVSNRIVGSLRITAVSSRHEAVGVIGLALSLIHI